MISSSTILLQQDLFGCVAGAETVNDKVDTNLIVICVWCHASSPPETLQILFLPSESANCFIVEPPAAEPVG